MKEKIKQICKNCVYLKDIPEEVRDKFAKGQVDKLRYCDKCKVLVDPGEDICACFKKEESGG